MTFEFDVCLIGFAVGLFIGAAATLINNIIFSFFKLIRG